MKSGTVKLELRRADRYKRTPSFHIGTQRRDPGRKKGVRVEKRWRNNT